MGNLTITGTPVSSLALANYITRVRDLVDDVCSIPTISLTKSAGGALAAGAINVRVSAITEFGETLPCNRASITVSINDKVTVLVTRISGATSYRVYASTGTNVETFQTEVTLTQAATLSVVLSSIASGNPLPTSDTATILVPFRSYGDAVEAAIYRYSSILPLTVYHDDTLVNGTKEYDLPTDTINVSKIQYPLADYPPNYLEENEYFVKDGQWCFVSSNPATGSQARVYYTTSHTADSIPDRHFEPVCNMAAAVVCEQLASRYTRMSRRNIGADSVDYRLRATDSRKDAEVFMATAFRELGIKDLEPSSYSVVMDWNEEH